MRRRDTSAASCALNPFPHRCAKAIQGEVGQLSAAVIQDRPIRRVPTVKRLIRRWCPFIGGGLALALLAQNTGDKLVGALAGGDSRHFKWLQIITSAPI